MNVFRFGQIMLIWLLLIFRVQAVLKCKEHTLFLCLFVCLFVSFCLFNFFLRGLSYLNPHDTLHQIQVWWKCNYFMGFRPLKAAPGTTFKFR